MKKQNKHFTPEWITSLSDCEIFVFGSNLPGQHGGGAARIAYEKFGARWGVGVGPTGRCYAIPTMHGGLEDIRPYVDQFLEYAREHPMNRFLLTRVGCGIAGFRDQDMARLFWQALDVPNISFPREWLKYMVAEHELIDPRSPACEIVNAPDEEELRRLSEKYAYQIGAGIADSRLPHLRIRYIKDENEFGYVGFGDFYFYGDDLYVWDTDERWKESHNQDMAETLFQDQCLNRGYLHRAIFAGVRSPFKDDSDDLIFTGDVVRIERGNGELFGHATLRCSNGVYVFRCGKTDYLFSELRNENYRIEREGTLFYNVDEGDGSVEICALCENFARDCQEDLETALQQAVITPSFGDTWKHNAMGILGIEYHWRK